MRLRLDNSKSCCKFELYLLNIIKYKVQERRVSARLLTCYIKTETFLKLTFIARYTAVNHE